MKKPPPKKPRSRGAVEPKAKPFDLWLDRGLHQLYDAVASEPVPEELLKLIEDDEPK